MNLAKTDTLRSDLPVLVIDDEPSVRSVLRALLERQGLRVRLADCAEEGLACLDQERYVMVLSDIMMPGLSGLELLVRVRTQHPELPVVMMTGYPTLERVVEALQGGASDFLVKPIDTRALLRTVERVCSARISAVVSAEAQSYATQRLSLRIPSRIELIKGTVDFICERSMLADYYPSEVSLQVRLALNEALGNAHRHGNREDASKHIEVEVEIDAHAFRVTVTDEGEGFEPSRVPSPLSVNLLDTPSGRGLFLIGCYMDEITFNEKGNAIRMRKQHPSPAAHAAVAEPLRQVGRG